MLADLFYQEDFSELGQASLESNDPKVPTNVLRFYECYYSLFLLNFRIFASQLDRDRPQVLWD